MQAERSWTRPVAGVLASPPRSLLLAATSGPTDNSASVTAVIVGSSGRSEGSVSCGSRITTSCREHRVARWSQRLIDDLVDVSTQADRIDMG